MSIKPGTQQYAELDPAIGLTSSVTQDPLTPVEMGTAANNTAYTTTNSNGAPIPDQTSDE